METISTPPPRHRCDLPGQPWNQHWELVGTIIACEDCGQHWRSEQYPRVTSGSQMTGNRWVKIREPRRPRPVGDWPPPALVACALLWIGMAADRYLPTLCLNIMMTAMAVVVVVVCIRRMIRRRTR